jgi:hypothetical protein
MFVLGRDAPQRSLAFCQLIYWLDINLTAVCCQGWIGNILILPKREWLFSKPKLKRFV